ncbi:MAG: N-acetylglucosamine-6-phosphate deacetylase [Gordonibacter sp.]|nr:N-acetylglucosamine-6-phosphate deacetylase [Gordonibacter sp.]
MRIVGGSVFDGKNFTARDLFINQDKFVEVIGAVSIDGEIIDAAGCYVIPGLVDVHFHGCCGADLCDGTDEALSTIARHEAQRGVTSICPATMTYPETTLAHILSVASAHHPADDEARLVGINMEGPFISPNKIGAQNPAYVQVPDVGMMCRLQEAARGLVKLVDIAPEAEGALEFIDEMAGKVRVSLAHTAADYDCAAEALRRGARQITHLYNAMPSLHHREPGPIAAAFENDEVTAELIADGIHIHPAMVRMAFTLFGDDRIILVSDTMRAAGLEDGNYDLGGQNVVVRGNAATLASGTLAGSVTDLASCLQWAVIEAGIPLESAVKAATINPARAIGVEGEAGSLLPGYPADAVILGQDLSVKQVILRGKLL